MVERWYPQPLSQEEEEGGGGKYTNALKIELSKKNIEEIIKTVMNQVVRKLHLPPPLNKHEIFSGVFVAKSEKQKQFTSPSLMR